MTTRYYRAALAVLAAAALAGRSAAWEEKGHLLVNRLAAESMPAGTPAFFKAAVNRLAYLGPEPDRWRVDAGDQLYAINGPDHFMDYEPVADLTLPRDRYRFIALLDSSGVLKERKLTADRIGFAPYRVAELTQTLQSEWRDWKKAEGSTDPAVKAAVPQIEQDIIYSAGVLGHYVADIANPLHTTVHYNGWDTSYAPNPKGYTTLEAERPLRGEGFHARFEGSFVEAAIDAKDVAPLVAPVKPVGPILDDTMAYFKASNALVPAVYDLEKAGDFKASEPSAAGKRFVQERLAAAASKLRDIWSMAVQGVPPRRPKAEG